MSIELSSPPDDIWYRDELLVLRDLVQQEINSGTWNHDLEAIDGLRALYKKLVRLIPLTPKADPNDV